jgi:hypothetical protein
MPKDSNAGVTQNLPSTAKPDIIDSHGGRFQTTFLPQVYRRMCRAKTPSESSDYCGWSSLNATGACLLNPGGRQIFGQQRSLCGLLNVPVDMRCARNPAPESDADVFVREPFRLRTARERRRHRVGFSSSTRHFSIEGLAALPLASCQRIALSSCALTASGREKFIAADFFAPGAFLSFIR